MLQVYRSNTVEWSPSPVLALATSPDDSQVAAARKDGSLEIWLVSPGSVGWHCQITIHGDPDPNSQVSSLVWCRSGGSSSQGRLFSSSLNGSVYEWDLFDLRQKTVLVSIGVSIHQMAAAPYNNTNHQIKQVCKPKENGHANGELKNEEDESSDSEVDDDSIELCEDSVSTSTPIALACQDGCVRLYSVSGSNKFTYTKSLPRVSGCILSVTWSPDSNIIYSGSSDGIIRCWDANLMRELYRITVGLGGLGSGRELCIFSLLALRNGTLVSADETGSVQFWDSQHGTLIQAHSYHKGHAKALTAVPGHNRVFSAGSDGQVILYKLSAGEVESSPTVLKKWVYIGYARVHTHDVNALTVAVPISQEDVLPDEKVKRIRGKKKPIDFSYHEWAHFGVPMLISAGDDTKIFAYSAKEFSKFSPHDICPAPQRAPIQLVLNTDMNQSPLLLVQGSYTLDIFTVRVENGAVSGSNRGFSGGHAAINLLAHIESDEPGKIICSTMSPSGEFLAYSGYMKTCLYELKKQERNNGRCTFAFNKKCLPHKLPFAHSLAFSSDSSQLMIAGHDRRIYVLDVGHLELLHVFTPCRKEHDDELQPAEPPITKMFTSLDGQWLAAVNCFGDVYIFNLEIQRQHWFISRLDGASVTAGGFTPQNSNVLIISTSSNQVFAFDVESKQLGEWSMRHSFVLPRRYQEFPGEVIGLSFVPSSNSSSVIVYSARALCLIDFGMPIDQDDGNSMGKPQDSTLKKIQNGQINGKLKRKVREYERETVHSGMTMENFEIRAFRHPILFLGHLSKNSLLIIEKPWMEVVRTFDSKPVHRNSYGT